MNILLYCPSPGARAKVSEYITQLDAAQLLVATTQKLVVELALRNDIKLAVLFDPTSISSIINLQDFLREKKRRMRVRILPSDCGQLMPGWQDVISDALIPARPRERPARVHPRFQWKPRE